MMRRRLHLTENVHDMARQLEKICQEIPQEDHQSALSLYCAVFQHAASPGRGVYLGGKGDVHRKFIPGKATLCVWAIPFCSAKICRKYEFVDLIYSLADLWVYATKNSDHITPFLGAAVAQWLRYPTMAGMS
ncbi:hypothetical protein TNCV_2613751 [Trichonephila clavipes]|nr:hypothetical protein TNCV_2613751 [Trichonephila clavipes]